MEKSQNLAIQFNHLPSGVRQHVLDRAEAENATIEAVIGGILAGHLEQFRLKPFAENVNPRYWAKLPPQDEFAPVKVKFQYNFGKIEPDSKAPRTIKVPHSLLENETHFFACAMNDPVQAEFLYRGDFLILKESREVENGDLVLHEVEKTPYLHVFLKDGGWVNWSLEFARQNWNSLDSVKVIGIVVGIVRGLHPNAIEGPGSALTNMFKS